MVMPEMGAPRRRRSLPAAGDGGPVSGHTDTSVEGRRLQKPFTPDVIARAVRAALDAVTRTAISAAP
jgi:hypothetical protein